MWNRLKLFIIFERIEYFWNSWFILKFLVYLEILDYFWNFWLWQYFVNSGFFREDHIAGHGSRWLLVEPEEQMIGTHLVLADQAVTTLLARNDLLSHDQISYGKKVAIELKVNVRSFKSVLYALFWLNFNKAFFRLKKHILNYFDEFLWRSSFDPKIRRCNPSSLIKVLIIVTMNPSLYSMIEWCIFDFKNNWINKKLINLL